MFAKFNFLDFVKKDFVIPRFLQILTKISGSSKRFSVLNQNQKFDRKTYKSKL